MSEAENIDTVRRFYAAGPAATDDERCALAIVHVNGTRRGHTIKTHGGHVFRFDKQGRIAEAWGFTEQQAELDDFFRA